MLKFLYIAFCALIINATAASADQVEFFSSYEDLPLMFGLVQHPEKQIIFDKPQGRIIISEASSDNITPEKIIEFYDNTLPSLGWKKESLNSYLRDGERLKIEFKQEKGVLSIFFSISPQINLD